MSIDALLVGAGTAVGDTAVTASGTSVAGDRFAISIAFDATRTITSVTDSKGNSYSAQGTPEADTNGGLAQWYYSAGGSAGAGHTATVVCSGAGFHSIALHRIPDGAASPHSGSAQGLDGGGQPFLLTSDAMPTGNYVALAMASNNTGSNGAYSANASTPTATLLHSEGSVTNFWTHGTSKMLSSGSSTVTPSFNRSGTAGGNTAMAILVIEESIASGPTVSSTSSSSPAEGSTLTITGTGFGASQGGSSVTIGGVSQGTATSWSDTSIEVTVSKGTGAGSIKNGVAVNVVVTVSGSPSNSYSLTGGVLPQSGRSYIDIVTPNSTADYRIESSPDLQSGYQVEYENLSGLVEVFDDGSIAVDPSVTEFDARVWDDDGGGWGSIAVQTIASGAVAAVDLSATGWVPNTGNDIFETIDENSPNDADYAISPPVDGAVVDPYIGELSGALAAGSYVLSVRARIADSTSADVRVSLLDSTNAVLASGSWQTLTSSFSTYTDTVSIASTATRMQIEVRQTP